MFFIFKKLRRSFFLPGKVRTYVAYAIGEIVLIVLGILIAVQIGNWNTSRGERKLAENYKTQLIANLERDVVQQDFLIEMVSIRLELIDFMLRVADEPELALEHPVKFMMGVEYSGRTTRTPVIVDTFEELQSTGYLRLLDEEIKRRLFTYYNREERLQFRNDKNTVEEMKYHELSMNVLNKEQKIWLHDKYGGSLFPSEFRDAVSASYDAKVIFEAAQRLSLDKELIDWLGTFRRSKVAMIGTVTGSRGLAEELIELLGGTSPQNDSE